MESDEYVIALEPICAKCGEYFGVVNVTEDWPSFVEWKCGCRARVLHYPTDYVVLDKLSDGVEKSIFFNGFVVPIRVMGMRGKTELDAEATVVAIRAYAQEHGLTNKKVELVEKLKALHLAKSL